MDGGAFLLSLIPGKYELAAYAHHIDLLIVALHLVPGTI